MKGGKRDGRVEEGITGEDRQKKDHLLYYSLESTHRITICLHCSSTAADIFNNYYTGLFKFNIYEKVANTHIVSSQHCCSQYKDCIHLNCIDILPNYSCFQKCTETLNKSRHYPGELCVVSECVLCCIMLRLLHTALH